MNSTLGSVVPLAMFLDFPQNFRLSTWNQYCTQAIAWSTILDGGNTILDGGSTILDGSSTIFCRISQFTHFCRDLQYVAIYALFPQFIFGQNSLSASSHVFCMYGGQLALWFIPWGQPCAAGCQEQSPPTGWWVGWSPCLSRQRTICEFLRRENLRRSFWRKQVLKNHSQLHLTNVLESRFEICGEVQLHLGQLEPSVGDLHLLEDLLEVQRGKSSL